MILTWFIDTGGLYLWQVGGLGDVVTSLSRAVQDLNHKVHIVLPKYDCLSFSNVRLFLLLWHLLYILSSAIDI